MFAISLQNKNVNQQPATLPTDLEQILHDFTGVFKEPIALPPVQEIQHQIILKEGSEPVNVRPYRYAYFQKAEIEKQDGSWRFCTDYRALNAVTVKDRFPIPTVDDMLDELHGANYFTKLDLRAGYHQVRVNPHEIYKTAFRTDNGHYEYLVMAFGLCNAPSTFQALLNAVFRPYLRKFILVFFDDILIYSKNWSDHLKHVRATLEILQDNQFFVNRSKCAFGKQEVEYFVTSDGVQVDQSKIKVMIDWPPPSNITKLRGFLGLTGYYRKFLRNYGIIAQPLTNLLRKDKFSWTHDAESAFIKLKSAMANTPTLAMPNFEEPFFIESDACDFGIGAVLSQQQRPVAFMSRAIGISKKSWSIYAKEMLAIVEAIRTWRPYLLGHKFYIQTDQRSLKYLLEQQIGTPEQQKWVSKLLGYDYEIFYKPGKENSAADALSRLPGPNIHSLYVPESSIWEEIKAEISTSPYLIKLGDLATQNPGNPYTWKNGLLYYKSRVIIAPDSPIISRILREFHNTVYGGHSGVLRTYKCIAQIFYWPLMRQKIQEFVAACSICQRNKSDILSPAGLLQPLPVPCRVCDDISMDFIDGLPASAGKSVIMVVVDRLTEYAHFVPLAHPYIAKSVAQHFLEGVVKLHGMPRSIISDRDPIFISHFWQEFFKMSDVKLQLSSAYHPQTDGQTEVVNRILEQYLRCFAFQKPRSWLSFLAWEEYWYNSTFHSSIGMTPFEALYGRLPHSIPCYNVGDSPVNEVDQTLRTRDDILHQLKFTLHAANNRMKQLADKHRRDVVFTVGDYVFLRLHPYRQQTVFCRAYQKLACKFYGPYQVTECDGPVAYRLNLPAASRIHPIFHVSALKKCVGIAATSSELPPLDEDGLIVTEPESILNTRQVCKGGHNLHESLVKWKGLSSDDATWEDTAFLHKKILNLEDKVDVPEVGNDRYSSSSTTGPGELRRSTRVRTPNPKYLP
ncbi:hypothetical protein AgCh_022090 [Apium graveolens]